MEQKLAEVFAKSLDLPLAEIVDNLKYAESPAWDSVAHMALIASIEEQFDIMIDVEDVIDMSSFAEAKRIVAKYTA